MQAPPEPHRATTIPALLASAAGAFGNQSALEDGDAKLGFRELYGASVEAARALLAAGVSPGDRVSIWAPNVWEWVVASMGISLAGGVIVGLNTRYKAAEAAYQLRRCGARVVFTMGGEFLGTDYVAMLHGEDLPELETIVTIRGAGDGAVEWSEFLARGAPVSEDEVRRRAAAVSPDDVSDLIFTSGTTGSPKAAMTCHGQNLRAFAAWSEVVSLAKGDRYLIAAPFMHSFGFKAGVLACLMRGATMLPQAVFDPAEILERVGRDRISVLPGAPAFYQSFLAHPDLARFDISNLRLAVMGAASIPVDLVQRMRDDLGIDLVITGYGLTEACGIATMCRYDDDVETIATTSGRAIPDVEVRCVDGDGKEVPRGEPGEIVVRGYNVMKGYFDDEAATAEAIDDDGWLHTGDVGEMDERGYVRITDRIKDMFIMGGFNCYPAEIESQMFASGDYAQVAVIGVPDERMGEVAMAFAVPAPGRELSADGVIAWCRNHMANYKVPRYVEFLSELPLNASGKVSKLDLRELARQLGHG